MAQPVVEPAPPHPLIGPPDLRATGERIDALLDASAAGTLARERSEELVRLVADLYGAGLERVLDLLHESGHLDETVLAALADDDLVASLLLVHGLHPYPVETRVERALDGVRPYLGSHGGDVELLDVTAEGTVRLRLLGSCDGCPSSSATLQLAVEGAIEAAAPEVTSIEVEVPSTDATGGPGTAGGPLIPVASLRSRLEEHPGAAWVTVPELADLAPGAVTTAEAGGCTVLACRVGEDRYAFRDHCPLCEDSLAGATLARRLGGGPGDALLTCPGCHGRFEVRRAGRCVDVPEEHLDPLPLLADGPAFSVATTALVVT